MHLHDHRTGEPLAALDEPNGDGCTKPRGGLHVVPCLAVCFEDDDGQLIPLKVFPDEQAAEQWVRRRLPDRHPKAGHSRGHYRKKTYDSLPQEGRRPRGPAEDGA